MMQARLAKAGIGALVIALALGGVARAGEKVVRPHPGRPGSWQLIGETTANFKADHDEIVVKGPYDNFRRIKIKVSNAPLNIARLLVVYDNGEPDKIPIRARIPDGGESRSIDLRGPGKRSLRRIDFWYDTAGVKDGKAHVEVFGEK